MILRYVSLLFFTIVDQQLWWVVAPCNFGKHTWSLPQWIMWGAEGRMWCVCKYFNNLEDACTQWLFNEGVYLSDLYYFVFDCIEYLQLSWIAIERSVQKQSEFAACIRTHEADQLVFVDESAVDWQMTYHGRAWAICGRKATQKAFFCRGWQYICSCGALWYFSNNFLLRILGTAWNGSQWHNTLWHCWRSFQHWIILHLHLSLAGCDGTFPSPKFSHHHG